MKEPELNSENENPQDKRVDHAPAADYLIREELEQELREAITKIKGKNKENNKIMELVLNGSVKGLTHV